MGLQPRHGPGYMVACLHGVTLLLRPEVLVDELCCLVQEFYMLLELVHDPPCLRPVPRLGFAAPRCRGAPLQRGLHRRRFEQLAELRLQQLPLRAGGRGGVAGATRVLMARGGTRMAQDRGLPLRAPHVTGRKRHSVYHTNWIGQQQRELAGAQGTDTAKRQIWHTVARPLSGDKLPKHVLTCFSTTSSRLIGRAAGEPVLVVPAAGAQVAELALHLAQTTGACQAKRILGTVRTLAVRCVGTLRPDAPPRTRVDCTGANMGPFFANTSVGYVQQPLEYLHCMCALRCVLHYPQLHRTREPQRPLPATGRRQHTRPLHLARFPAPIASRSATRAATASRLSTGRNSAVW